MQHDLPHLFQKRMQSLLGADFPDFLAAYEQTPWHGLRVNTLKVDVEAFLAVNPFPLHPVAWCKNGFYFPENERPGKHPYHAAGLYYIQEPSAMAVAEVVGAKPGETVLDLCAAPGGKTTQLAAAMRGTGVLIANEIHPSRAKALSENVERLGITNAIVTNETPERLAERFPGYFDRILVDAPCSGEGMFRKLPEAIQDWSPQKVAHCHSLQSAILNTAARMLKPGGLLVYSTCTFAPEENEQTVATFLSAHPEFQLEDIPQAERFVPGQPEWADPPLPSLSRTARLWPHRVKGEGHFIAMMSKQGVHDEAANGWNRSARRTRKSEPRGKSARKEAINIWQSFARSQHLALPEQTADEDSFLLFGEQLYYSPAPSLHLDGLKVLRPGWHLGSVKRNRFEPSHALALALSANQATRIANYRADDPEVFRYLKGESLIRDGEDGWTLVTVDGYSLGWGKQAGGQLKNHYPKGLRWLN